MKYIITADWHLRSQRPRCRLDADWMETQRKALSQIIKYSGEYKADVIVIGDIFHSTNETTNEVIAMVQDFAAGLYGLSQRLFILAGNHDLPQHNLDNIHRSAFNILLNSVNIFHVKEISQNFDVEVSAPNFGAGDIDSPLMFKHTLCFPENYKVFPGAEKAGARPSELFGQFKNAKTILTGDYHRAFDYNKGKKWLLNPGCLIRQAADMIDYEPSVFFLELTDDGVYDHHEVLSIPDSDSLVTDEYLETEKERNGRIEAFIERIKDNEQVSFDFVENVHTMMKNNKIDAETKNIILELMENT